MAGLTTGSVQVDVRPNLKDWNTRLRAQILPQATKLGREVGDAIGRGIETRVKAAMGDALRSATRRAIPAATQAGAQTGGAFARGFKERVRAALAAMPDVRIDADTSGARAEIAALRARLHQLSRMRIGIDIDADEAQGELARIARRLRALGEDDPEIDVRVDTRKAAVELEGFERTVSRLDGREIDVPVTSRTLSTARRYRSHLTRIIEAIIAFAPALVPAAAALTAWTFGLVAGLGAATGAIGAFGLAVAGSAASAIKAVVELRKLESKLADTADAAERLEVIAEINQHMRDMSAPARRFAQGVDRMSASWQMFVAATQTRTLGLLTSAMDTLRGALVPLPALVHRIVPVFSRWLTRMDTWVHGAGYAGFVGFFLVEGPRALENVMRLIAGLSTGVGGLIRAFTPFGQDFLQVLAEGAERFAIWGQQLGATSGFRGFIAYVRETGPQVVATVRALWDALIALVQAIAPLAGPWLGVIRTMAELLKTLADTAPGLITLSLALFAVNRALSVVGRVSTAASTGLTRLRGAIGRARTAGGGLRAALGGLVGALGGGWGLAVGGAIAALGLLANAQAKAEAEARELRDSLDQTTGALTKQSKAIIATQLAEKGAIDAARELGISTELVGRAARGHAPSIRELHRQIDMLGVESLVTAERSRELTEAEQDVVVNARILTSAVGDSVSTITEQKKVIDDTQSALGGYRAAGSRARFATKEQAEAHAEAGEAIRDQRNALGELLSAMKRHRTEALALRNAEIAYEAAVDDVTESIKENGRTHDINTEKGRANETALIRLAEANNALAEDTRFLNRPLGQQAGILQRNRADFIKAARSMGYTREEARKLAEQYLKTPKEVKTEAKLEAQLEKLKAWKKSLDTIQKKKETDTKVNEDKKGVSSWVKRLRGIMDEKVTDLLGNPIRRGLDTFRNWLGNLPRRKDTKLRAQPQRSGVDRFLGWLRGIPSAVTTVLTTIKKTITGGEEGGIVGYAHGTADVRHGALLPGYSRKDDTLAMVRRGEAVLVPEVARWLGRATIDAWNAAGNAGRTPRWFDNGGTLPPGATLAFNGTGRSEFVLTSRQMDALTQGAPEVRVYLGDQEITGMVRTEIRQHDRNLKRRVVAGTGSIA